jgi:beta-1,4-mannosyl-glycoprotein beta-1,4-N-acetylglucosaminyltransferase
MTYDCFCYNGESTMLEIRFNILDKYVDKFVLCESQQTFSGNWKPLYWAERGDGFEQWEHKVIHHVVGPKDFDTAFERAAYQKDNIRNALKDCKPDDLIYYSDVDEVWRPQKREGKLRQLAYSYQLNNRTSEDWQGTNVIRYKNLYNLNELRANHDVVLENGGWHWTNVMPIEQIINKLESYDHEECNIPWVKDGLRARMEANVDYLGRTHDWKGNPFKLWVDEKDLPKYILDNKELWLSKGLWRQ